MLNNKKPSHPAEAEQEWVKYIGAVDTYDAPTVDTERIWKDLNAMSQHLFGKKTEVWVSEEQYHTNLDPMGNTTGTRSDTSCAQEQLPAYGLTGRVLNDCEDVAALVEGVKPSHRIVYVH